MSEVEPKDFFPDYLLNSNHFWLVLLDSSLVIRWANESFCRLLGWQTYLERSLSDMTSHAEMISMRLAAILQTNGGSTTLRLQHIGGVLEVFEGVWEFSYCQGMLVGVGHMASDKTYHEANFLPKTPSEGFMFIDESGQVLELNDAMADLIGMSKAKILGHNYLNVLPKTTTSSFGTKLQAALQWQKVIHFEDYLPSRNRWLRFSAYPLRQGLSVFCRDISAQKSSEKSIMEAMMRVENIVSMIPGFIFEFQYSPKPRFNYISPGLAQIIGKEVSAVLDNPALLLRLVHPEDRQTLQTAALNSINTRQNLSAECRVMIDNQEIWVSILASVSFEGEDSIIFYGHINDITSLKQTQFSNQLIRSQLEANLSHTPNVAVQWYDEQARIIYWNPASERLYGFTQSEALGKTLDQLILTPAEAEGFWRILQRIKQTGEPYGPYETPVMTRSGEKKWVLATTFGMPLGNGNLGFVCMDVDITRRKLVEEQLIENEHHLRSIAENVPGGIVQFELYPDGQSKVLFTSPACAEIWGISLREFEAGQNPIFCHVLPSDKAALLESLQQATAMYQPWVHQWRIQTSDKQTKWLEGRGKPRLRKNNVMVWYVVVIDITAEKLIEKRLAHTQELLNRTGELAKTGGWEYDFEEGTFFWTKQTYRIHEVDDDFVPDAQKEKNFYEPEDFLIAEKALKNLMNTGEPFDLELRFITAKRNRLWVRVIGTPIIREGRIVGASGAIQDITHIKTAQNHILAQNRALEEIAWKQSHQLRSPVANIIGLVQLIKQDFENNHEEFNQKYMDFLLKETQRLDDIIHQIVGQSVID